jgi:ParB family chromosome partitioning protein
MTKLPITKIRVRNRYRKKLGDIESLATSIKELGLLHPIVVRPDGRLIAGERRLAACKRLGWKTVPVTYVNLKEVVRGEFAENAYRKDFLHRKLRPFGEHSNPTRERRRRSVNVSTPGLPPAVANTPGKFPQVIAEPEIELGPSQECPAAVSRKFRPSSKQRSSSRSDFAPWSAKWTETVE